jgi:uncharacterized membrane protein YgcG
MATNDGATNNGSSTPPPPEDKDKKLPKVPKRDPLQEIIKISEFLSTLSGALEVRLDNIDHKLDQLRDRHPTVILSGPGFKPYPKKGDGGGGGGRGGGSGRGGGGGGSGEGSRYNTYGLHAPTAGGLFPR